MTPVQPHTAPGLPSQVLPGSINRPGPPPGVDLLLSVDLLRNQPPAVLGAYGASAYPLPLCPYCRRPCPCPAPHGARQQSCHAPCVALAVQCPVPPWSPMPPYCWTPLPMPRAAWSTPAKLSCSMRGATVYLVEPTAYCAKGRRPTAPPCRCNCPLPGPCTEGNVMRSKDHFVIRIA